jgi:predicted GNAT family acetyltransferase
VDANLDNLTVTHDEEARRFEIHAGGLRALLTYRRFPGRIILDHAEVPKLLEGHGVAARLARFALDFARANHLQVVPLCPYVSSFIRKHPEYQDLVSSDDLQKLRSR